MRLIIEALIGMFIGIIVLFTIIYMISMQKPTVSIDSRQKITQQPHSAKEVIDSSTKILECMDGNETQNSMHCFETDKKESVVSIPKSNQFTIIMDKFLESKLFIQFIYGAILVALMIQLILFMESFYLVNNRYKWLERNRYNISEYSTNTPPVLGVAATLFAFGAFAASSSSSGELMTLFRENVFDAVTTTIYGSLVYTINSLLHIKIAQEEESR